MARNVSFFSDEPLTHSLRRMDKVVTHRKSSAGRPIRAFQWDLARQVERLEVLLALLPKYAEWGYQELYLHLEDAVEYPSFPAIARTDAYRRAELAKLVRAAQAVGIGVVPIVNLLGHTQYLIKTDELRDLNELRAPDGSALERGQICPLHPRTLQVAAALIEDMRPFCTAGKIHVGLDESFHLGKCPRCRAEIQQRGLAYHFGHYASQLRALANARGLRMGLWADMLALVPATIEELPRDVIAYDWYYYPFKRHPRVELYNFKEADLMPKLKARGIEYWGCPMNGAFRFEPLPIFQERLANVRDWWRRCKQVRSSDRGRSDMRDEGPVGGFLMTSWEAYRLALPLTTVVDAAAATHWRADDRRLNAKRGSNTEEVLISQRNLAPLDLPSRTRSQKRTDEGSRSLSDQARLAIGFERVFSLSKKEASRAAVLAWALDRYPFSGYAAWELHTDWTVRAGLKSVRTLEKSVRALRALAKKARAARGMPLVLTASTYLRLYWEERALFVQRAADAVFNLRRLVARADNRKRDSSVRLSIPEDLRLGGRTFLSALTSDERNSLGKFITRLRQEAAELSRALRVAERAARQMWIATRDPNRQGQNEEILAEDRRRLVEWTAWLNAVRKNPRLSASRTPVCGVYQCVFTVENFEPAVQRVSLEQRQLDGSWKEIRGRHTIEFRAEAAQPNAKIHREFSAPLDNMDGALRVVCRGVGRVRILDARCTDGITRVIFQKRFLVGKRAPRSGWPDVYEVTGIRELQG